MGDSTYADGMVVTLAGQSLADATVSIADPIARTVKVIELLTDLRVEQSTHLPDVCTLRFMDHTLALVDAATFAIGGELSVSLEGPDGSLQTITTCEVTSIAVEPDPGGQPEMVITAHDKGHRLARGVKVRTFSDQSDSDIATAVAGDHGLQADVDATTVVHPHVMQAASDYAFLNQRAALAGRVWWVSDGKLHFKEDPSGGAGSTLTWGDNLLSFRARFSAAESQSSVEVRTWDPDTQQAVVGQSRLSPSMANGLGTDAPAGPTMAQGGRDLSTEGRFVGNIPAQDQSAANAFAESLARRAMGTEMTLRGVADGDPSLKAGTSVQIDGIGTQLSGSYVLTRVEHVFGAGEGHVTRFESGGVEPAQMADLVAPRSGGANTDWARSGLVIGVVTNLDDPERPTGVKVRFPTLSDADESAWARLLGVGAGPQRGLMIYPEIDDEVLVGFEHGDPARPVVLGGLWSKANQPPKTKDDVVANGKVTGRVFKSRLGHVIEIVDGDSASDHKIVIALSDNATKLVLAEDGVTLDAPSDITITGDKAITVKAATDLTLQGSNVTIKAGQKVAIQGAQLEGKGSGSAKLEGATLEMKGSATAKLDGGAMTEIKGGLVKLN